MESRNMYAGFALFDSRVKDDEATGNLDASKLICPAESCSVPIANISAVSFLQRHAQNVEGASAICTLSPATFVARPSVVHASLATWPSHMRNDRFQLPLRNESG